ncbi:unnamed protein product [Closterium sp. Naga37s-1]|nr:unnamed protein product [Closterium sp. Naga37s-1]
MAAKRPAYDEVAATALPFLLLMILSASTDAAARPTISALLAATGPAAHRVGGAGRAEHLARRALQDVPENEPGVESPEECQQGELKCPSGGGCMLESQVCDGKPHCSDGSDESPDFCRSFDCGLVNKDSCPSGTGCMPPGTQCNGEAECADGSDEGVECLGFYPGGPPDSYQVGPDYSNYCSDQGMEQCPSEWFVCLQQQEFCDGYQTCSDGYDERNCANHVCSAGMIQCPKTFYCARGTMCDGVQDCVATAEAEDEDKAFCSGYSCPDGFKKCADGLQCVAEGLFCDGTVNCNDGSDEGAAVCAVNPPAGGAGGVTTTPPSPPAPAGGSDSGSSSSGGSTGPSGGTVVLSAEEVARQRKEAAARRAAAVAAKKQAAAAKHAAVEARRAKQEAKAAAIAEKKKKQEEKAAAVAEKKRLQEAKAAAIAEKKKKQEEKAAAVAEKKRKQAEKAAAIEAKKK